MKRAKLAELNVQEEILSSLSEVQKNQANEAELNLRDAYIELVKSNDRQRLREAEMLFHTFYEGGSDYCKHQYARHINRLLLESLKK